jgi:hypothetical protein
MRPLPTGTVSFLVTDIEGSTRLLSELGDDYAEVLAEHRRLLREAFTRHGGVEVDTQGDAFFVAFARASDAVAAASEARAVLADGPVRVRIGIHTGEPIVTQEGYVGVDVHRAARVCAAGHGGQVLLTQTTRDLVDGLELRDLGEHRLKDLAEPQRLYQLGSEEFLPLKTLDATNLPIVVSSLLDREAEIAELVSLLSNGSRLVTVTGAGGTGKTRLALQVAAELAGAMEDGVFWVPLADLSDPDLVLPTVAQTLGAKGDLSSSVRDREALLLLDNAEHVLAAAAALAQLLASAPRLRLLVTSRAPLHLSGEREYPLEPLPDDDAVMLFVERARSVVTCNRTGPWRRSAAASTGSRSRSSWPPRARSSSTPPPCSAASSTLCRYSPAARGTPPSVSAPCGRRSSGATSCCPRNSSSSSGA